MGWRPWGTLLDPRQHPAPAIPPTPARQPAPHPHPCSTFALPVGVCSKADVAAVLAVELSHECLVGVTNEQDGSIEGLNLLLATLMCLDADGPAAAPVVPLTFEPCSSQRREIQSSEPRDRSPAQYPRPTQEACCIHLFLPMFTEYLCARHCAGRWE